MGCSVLKVFTYVLVFVSLWSLPSCKSALLDPFHIEDHYALTRNNAALTIVNTRVKPVSAALGKRELTLADCRSIALANNLELQAARIDEVTKFAIQESNKKKILPHVLATSEVSTRESLRYSFSNVLGQYGRPPTPPNPFNPGVSSYSVGHEYDTMLFTLEARWSLTDAALAYYMTKSSINDRIKSHHLRVRTAQKLLETVDAAFFRLIGLQYCLVQAQNLVQIRTVSRQRFAQLAAKKIIRIEDLTRIEQKEIRALQILSKVRSDIDLQRNILASAMGVSPDICVDGGIVLIGDLEKPNFVIPECELEMQAVQNRPEAYEAGLMHLNSINDLKRTIVKYFPKITGFWRYTRDKDRFLLFNDWHEVGMYMFFDLTDFLSNRDESQAARANSAKTEREMGAVALGLTAQVRSAAIKYFASLDELDYSRQALSAANRILRAAEDRYSAQDIDRQTVQEARGDVLEANITIKRVLGEANALLAELQGTMGTNYSEPIPIK